MKAVRALPRRASLVPLRSHAQGFVISTRHSSVSWGRSKHPSAKAPAPKPPQNKLATQPAMTDTHIHVQPDGEGRIEVSSNGAPPRAWDTPGPAAYDFRSDTATMPTASMLASIASTTLLNDVLREDQTTNELEAFVAALLSPADFPREGLYVLSGTMGNQVALRTHLGSPPHGVVADHRSHLLNHEAGALSMVSQAFPQPAFPAAGASHISLADVRRAAIVDEDVHHAPTRLIALENTLGGAVMPVAQLREISQWARSHGIAVHMDGARLWDAAAALVVRGEVETLELGLRAYADCVDSVTVCFSKGLGAPVGSLLVGSPAFAKKARHVRKMLGGGTRSSGVVTAPALLSVKETFLGGKLQKAHAQAAKVAHAWTSRGGKLVGQQETGMVWLDLKGSGVADPKALKREADAEKLKGYWEGGMIRIVCHYQIADDAVERLERVFDKVLKDRKEGVQATANGIATGFDYGNKKE